MINNPIPTLLITWLAAGAVRILLGSSTSAVAYLFFGVFWFVSAVLLFAAVRLFLSSRRTEERVEAVGICAGVASLFVQGLLGNGDTIAIAAIVFFVSTAALIWIYIRRLRRRGLVQS